MQIRKSVLLYHHIFSTTVLCCVWICCDLPDMPFFASYSYHIITLLSCCVQRWCRRVFLCLSVFIAHPMMHYDSQPPSCRVLFWTAPSWVSTVSPFPSPLSLLKHSSDLFLPCYRRSNVQEREAGMSDYALCRYSWTISSVFCCFFSSAIWYLTVKDGRAKSQTQR